MTPTVRVRIAVAVGEDGFWSARGWMTGEVEAKEAVDRLVDAPHSIFWVEADLPIPQTETVEGTVSE